MSKEKETLKSHLINLLELDEKTVSADGLGFLDTEIKQYRNFLNKLKILECDPEADKIFKALYEAQITIGNLVAKKRGETVLLDEMHMIFDSQNEFYEKHLKSGYEQAAMNHNLRIGDAAIEIDEAKYKNSICVNFRDEEEDNIKKYDWDSYLQELDEKWPEYVGYLDQLLNLIFSSYYNNEEKPDILLNAPSVSEVISKEKEYYVRVKKNYSSCREDEKNDNPYKNLYVYYRNSYIHDFYAVDLPELEGFLEFKNYRLPFVKEKYILLDIANIYKSMMDLPKEKDIYGNMKKLFQGLQYMKLFKKNGEYEFDDVSIPLAEYAYYRKKNHKEPENIWLTQFDLLISNRYAPLLNVLIKNEQEKIATYNQMRSFLLEEYYDMYSTLSNRYQNSMLSFLMDSTVRIYYRCAGLPFEVVYQDWEYVFSDEGDYSM